MKRKIAFSIWLIIWGLILWAGIGLYNGVIEQHIEGYPSEGQFFVCIILPVTLTILNILFFVFSHKLNGFSLFFIFIFEIIALFSFMMVSGGV